MLTFRILFRDDDRDFQYLIVVFFIFDVSATTKTQ